MTSFERYLNTSHSDEYGGLRKTRTKNKTEEKPCKSCVDFKTWIKHKKKNSTDDDDDQFIPRPPDCPLDKDELGNRTWSFLHTVAARYPDNPTKSQSKDMNTFINLFAKFYPCQQCSEDFINLIEELPPQTSSQKSFSQWMCQVHNEVNKKLGKPVFDCRTVNERWRDGWNDGSCD